MERFARRYVRIVDGFNYRVGRLMMYGIFAMVAVLMWSSISKTFFTPTLWTFETAQFMLVAYFVLGGAYSIQLGSNVRMDLLYGSWSDRRKAWFDACTVLFLIFYLGVMVYGAIGSTAYSLGYFGTEPLSFFRELAWAFLTQGAEGVDEVLGHLERSRTAWRPYMWPVKLVMLVGIIQMLAQAISELFKDILKIREGAA